MKLRDLEEADLINKVGINRQMEHNANHVILLSYHQIAVFRCLVSIFKPHNKLNYIISLDGA